MKKQTEKQIKLKGLADLSMDDRYKNALKPVIIEKMNLAARNILIFDTSVKDTEFKTLSAYFYNLGRYDITKEILFNIDTAVEDYNKETKKSNQ